MKDKVIIMLEETYELEDLNKEENQKIQDLRRKINKHIGMMSVRAKHINDIQSKIRVMIIK